MFKSILSTTALAAILSATVNAPVLAADKEKCFGITAAGKNDCANLAGTHSCAGQSTQNKDVGEWKYVTKGECKKMKGLSKAEAEAEIKTNETKNKPVIK